MRPSAPFPAAPAGLLATLLAVSAAAPRAPAGAASDLPPIVFVSRQPLPDAAGAIPGLGPHHRAAVTGGRLLVRERDGRVRELLPPGAFVDVSDPAFSPGADRLAFAAVAARGASWRLWVVGADGGAPRQVTFDDAASGSRSDDLDPCWADESTLVFASTRTPRRAQYADVPVTDLYRVRVDPRPEAADPPVRVTAERNGAEEPAFDPVTGRLLFARWWFNRHRAADTPEGVTSDPAHAIPADSVNLWQTMSIVLAAPLPRLAAGDLASRRGTMGYQPAVLADGSVVAVYAANLGLSPRPGGTGLHLLPRDFARGRRLIGAIVSGRAGDAYGGAEGLAPPAACAPAGLPDGRVLFSYAPGARGDFGLWVMRADGSRPARVLDLPGTLELDAAPRVPRGPVPATAADPAEADPGAAPGTFRYRALDVFAAGPGAPGAAARVAGARLRFFATRPRPDAAAGDTAVLVREVAVGADGGVDEGGLPAGTPMFEQLVGADGRVLLTAHGPAHVAGSNVGLAGTTSRCLGCHLGHSTLAAARVPAGAGAGRR